MSSCAYDLHLGGVGFAGGAAGELGGLALDEQFVVATVAGGSASSLTGGEFANGAFDGLLGAANATTRWHFRREFGEVYGGN